MTVGSWESMMQAEDLPEPQRHHGTEALDVERRRIAVRREEAARMLSIGIDSLNEHVLPEIQVVRLGRMVLVPVEELQRWIERRATRVGAEW